jgi:hypothetical protein
MPVPKYLLLVPLAWALNAALPNIVRAEILVHITRPGDIR